MQVRGSQRNSLWIKPHGVRLARPMCRPQVNSAVQASYQEFNFFAGDKED